MFNIKPEAEQYSSCYYHPELLPASEKIQLNIPDVYTTLAAKYADIGYQLWNKGALTFASKEIELKIEESGKPSLKDEYVFVRRYWGKHWAGFALLSRLLSFHNPFAEINAYLRTSRTKKIDVHSNFLRWENYTSFTSQLVLSAPKVSVIIPTLNRYQFLKDVMEDLEKQQYKNFDVIVVDQSDNYNEAFYQQFRLDIKTIHQKEKLLWTARNNAIKISDAEYLLFFDDDSRVEPDWITEHLKCIDFFNADISAGVSIAVVGAKVPRSYAFFRWADQFDSGNALVKRELFKELGLFDVQFNKQRMGDHEFGTRAYINGKRSISNPNAKRVHLKVSEGGLREMGSWDAFRPKKWFAPKPIPSVVFLFKKYYPKSLYRNAMLLGIMLSNVHYRNKGSNKMLAFSIFLAIFKSPLLLIQFLKARNIANKMLAKDNGIELLQG